MAMGEYEGINEFNIRQAIIEGTNQTEELTGNGRDEWIYAYNGFDTIGAGGDDRPYGGLATTPSAASGMISSMASKTTMSSEVVQVTTNSMVATAMTTSKVVVEMTA